MSGPQILVAGIGNVFLGDDGFGVEVARRLGERTLPHGVRVVDFGIRGFDLALALLEPYDLVVLVDAARRGGKPGTLYLMEVTERPERQVDFQTHSLVPSDVFGAVRAMGGMLPNLFVLACEPEDFGDPDEGKMGLSQSVGAAIDEAIGMIESLLRRTLAGHETHA